MSKRVLREATPDGTDALAALVREAFEEYRDRYYTRRGYQDAEMGCHKIKPEPTFVFMEKRL